MVDLRQGKGVKNIAVFEQTPELQAGQHEGVIKGGGTAQSAVETVDDPQLFPLPHHHKLHLSQHHRREGTHRGQEG